jgi:heme-degrading monooxygenase HmoA
MTLYVYLWEFEVSADRQLQFEHHYGPQGSWVALFRQAEGYVDTLLLKDRTQHLRYVTVDRWESEDAYRAFRSRYSREYEELDAVCAGLTAREASLGAFNLESASNRAF